MTYEEWLEYAKQHSGEPNIFNMSDKELLNFLLENEEYQIKWSDWSDWSDNFTRWMKEERPNVLERFEKMVVLI